MNDTSRPLSLPRREDFPHRVVETVRFRDLDINGHVNNAIFSTYLETGRVDIIRQRTVALLPRTMNWMLVRVAIDYRAEVNWPGTVEVATALVRLGRSSITFNHALFFEDRCAATAESINVLVDLATRRPTDIPQTLRDGLAPFMRQQTSQET